jgi:hypothetical protein
MTTETFHELNEAVSELRRQFPEWRLGQLIANLTIAAGMDSEGAIWDVEDEQLLIAAKRLLERRRTRDALAA